MRSTNQKARLLPTFGRPGEVRLDADRQQPVVKVRVSTPAARQDGRDQVVFIKPSKRARISPRLPLVGVGGVIGARLAIRGGAKLIRVLVLVAAILVPRAIGPGVPAASSSR